MIEYISINNFVGQLIEEATYSGVKLPSLEWHTLEHKGKNARFTYRYVFVSMKNKLLDILLQNSFLLTG